MSLNLTGRTRNNKFSFFNKKQFKNNTISIIQNNTKAAEHLVLGIEKLTFSIEKINDHLDNLEKRIELLENSL